MIYNFFFLKPFTIWFPQLIKHWAKPATLSLIYGVLSDLTRSHADLIVENALLRQHLIVLSRQVKRPLLTHRDRFRLVLLACCTRFWKQALHIVQQDTLLIILHGRHLTRVVKEYTTFFNQERPHQGIGQRIPNFYEQPKENSEGRITSKGILGGLDHSYSRLTYPN